MSLNLDNFEAEDFSRETPYILTSPTSLQACSDLFISPIELVYRSLEEYEENFCDLPLSQVYKLYEENETMRQEKLLKCRAMRYKLKTTPSPRKPAINSCKSNKRSSTSKSNSNSNSNTAVVRFEFKEEPFRENAVGYTNTSDTESNEGGRSGQYSLRETKDRPNEIIYSSRSVPDLARGNLYFSKVSPSSPRLYCPCQFEPTQEEIFSEYHKRYGYMLDESDISALDKKILECLILKKGRNLEWAKKSQSLRMAIENEKIQRFAKSQEDFAKLQERLSEKRRIENIDNTRRYIELQDKWGKQRFELKSYLDERDRRVQNYLNELNDQKNGQMLAKQRAEALRQLEVSKTLEKMMEDDKRQREMLNTKLQRRMEEAEIRKKRREQDYWRHVSEMNRIEEVKRTLCREKIEQNNQKIIEALRNQIEEKEHRAHMNYLAKLRSRTEALGEGSSSRNKNLERAKTLHLELIKGLEEWHNKIYHLQIEAQERARNKYLSEINRRRARVASERILREERSIEMLKRVRENEEKRKELIKMVIESKEGKSARVKAQKEKEITISRIRAAHAAELRLELKEKLDPTTFDKRAARAEIEMRLLRQAPSFNFLKNYPSKLYMKRCNCRFKRSNFF